MIRAINRLTFKPVPQLLTGMCGAYAPPLMARDKLTAASEFSRSKPLQKQGWRAYLC
jgi:hypothetical protein